jgi:hypothetical protein
VWLTLASPALGWSLIAVLALSSAGVPVVVERQHQAAEQRQAALELERKQAAEEAARQAAASIDDEALLSGIDSDIAQAAPDAMQPLASLMSDSETRSAGTR